MRVDPTNLASWHRKSGERRSLAAGVTTAMLAAAMLATGAAPALAHGQDAATQISGDLASGHVNDAISLGERRVAASPRNASLRSALGAAYLKAGRFESAVAMLSGAQALGDTDGRTALNLALAEIATGRGHDAIDVLNAAQGQLTASDFGLAMALAGDAPRAVAVMKQAMDAGDETAMLRQNLGYAYALDGEWSDARLLASMDLAPDKVDERIGQWAATTQPEAYRRRVAMLLGAPLREDTGLPTTLALGDAPAAPAPAAHAPQGELAALDGTSAPAPVPAAVAAPQPAPVVTVAEAPAPAAAPKSVPQPTHDFAAFSPTSQAAAPEPNMAPVAGAAPALAVSPVSHHHTAHHHGAASLAAAEPAPTLAGPAHKHMHAHHAKAPALAVAPVNAPAPDAAPAAATAGHATKMVQLGSFRSRAHAIMASAQFAEKDPALAARTLTITEAVVKGRRYFRVIAGELDVATATELCGTVQSHGGACLAYSPRHRGHAHSQLALAGGAERRGH